MFIFILFMSMLYSVFYGGTHQYSIPAAFSRCCDNHLQACGLYTGIRHAQWHLFVFKKALMPCVYHVLMKLFLLVHGQVTIIFEVSVCLSVSLFVCAEFFSAVFDPILIKLGHMLYVWV